MTSQYRAIQVWPTVFGADTERTKQSAWLCVAPRTGSGEYVAFLQTDPERVNPSLYDLERTVWASRQGFTPKVVELAIAPFADLARSMDAEKMLTRTHPHIHIDVTGHLIVMQVVKGSELVRHAWSALTLKEATCELAAVIRTVSRMHRAGMSHGRLSGTTVIYTGPKSYQFLDCGYAEVDNRYPCANLVVNDLHQVALMYQRETKHGDPPFFEYKNERWTLNKDGASLYRDS